jgi:hypothetical protein
MYTVSLKGHLELTTTTQAISYQMRGSVVVKHYAASRMVADSSPDEVDFF